MDPVVIYILILLSLIFPIFRSNYKKKKLSNSFDDFFNSLSNFLRIKYNRGTFFNKSYLTKSGELYNIKITRELHRGAEYVIINLQFKKNLKYTFSISNETVSSKIKKSIGIDDILTHDKKFDEEILVKSKNIPYIISILKDKTRKNILRISKGNIIDLTNKDFTLYTASFDIPTISLIKKAMVSISDSIILNKDIKRNLLSNIDDDSNEYIQLNNIETYQYYYGNHESIEASLIKLLKSKELEIQIRSAIHLNKQGLPKLLHLIKSRKDIDEQWAIEIIKQFKKFNFNQSIDDLKNLFMHCDSKKTKVQILSTFQKICDESISTFLLDELKKNKSDISLKLIETLGICGTIDVIEPLYKLSENSHSRSQKREIKKSITKIQSRLGSVESGWLSKLSKSKKEGGLSINKNAGDGSLSVDE